MIALSQDRSKLLRRVIKLGSSIAVTLPRAWMKESDFVWIERKNGEIIIRAAEVS
jgi:antitoxin component of MazEF toxin-antitoxin module